MHQTGLPSNPTMLSFDSNLNSMLNHAVCHICLSICWKTWNKLAVSHCGLAQCLRPEKES